MAASRALMASLTHLRPLTCAASVSTSYPTRLVPQPPDLIKWVRKQGGFVHTAVKIAQDESKGLGLMASEEIPRGSDLIVLPHHVPLKFGSLESNHEDELDTVLVNLARYVPAFGRGTMGYETGFEASARKSESGIVLVAICQQSPETYSVPIFFPGEDIKNLQYAPLLHQVNKRCRFLLDFEQECRRALDNLKPDKHPFGGQEVDASALGWAMSAVSSRAFRLYGDKRSDGAHTEIPMMLPLIDMCNHSFNPNARIVQEKDTGTMKMLVKVVADTEIKQDDPLLLNYGFLSNDFFLLDYGFVVPSSPYDCVELKYDSAFLDAASMAAGFFSPSFSAPASWQEQVLCQLNLAGEAPDLKVTLGGREIVDGRLLAALRVLLTSDVEAVQNCDLNTLKSLTAEAPLGIANEVAALRTTIALCVIALGHFPTKIMDDESLLKQGASGSTELAIQFRIQKKSVIIDVMRDLTRWVKLLSSKEKATAEN